MQGCSGYWGASGKFLLTMFVLASKNWYYPFFFDTDAGEMPYVAVSNPQNTVILLFLVMT